MYLLFIGPPGAGKGTQAELLSLYTDLPLVSGGDLLRAAAEGEGIFAARIKARLDNGEIITDPFVMDLLMRRLRQEDCRNGAILDGCVRTRDQAVALDRILSQRGGITAVILLTLADDIAAARLLARRADLRAGIAVPQARRQTAHHPRPDDREQIIPKRLMLYREVTTPAIEYYRDQASLVELDGTEPISEIHQSILRALNLHDLAF
jgi:adenylate kinase